MHPIYTNTKLRSLFQNTVTRKDATHLDCDGISSMVLNFCTNSSYANRRWLDIDASDFAIGAVLSQKQNGVERIIAYASRSLDRRDQAGTSPYCAFFLKYFKQYLLGRKFKVRTDHAALTWLRKTPDRIGARWLEQMEEFDFIVEHRLGTSHGRPRARSKEIHQNEKASKQYAKGKRIGLLT